MTFVLGISGSLRKAATTTGLLRAFQTNVPQGIRTEIADLNMPIFNKDLEDSRSIPDSVRLFREQASAADAFVFSMPENAYGVSSPIQNAIDWSLKTHTLGHGNIFAGKVCAIIGVGATSKPKYYNYMKDWARDMQMTMIDKTLFVSRTCVSTNAFDLKTGEIISDEVNRELRTIAEEIKRATNKGGFDLEIPEIETIVRRGYYATA